MRGKMKETSGSQRDRQPMPVTVLPESALVFSSISASTESLEQINATRIRVSLSDLALPASGLIEVRS
jgi:hypothetical protein